MADQHREEPAAKIASALASRMAEDFPDVRIFVNGRAPRLHVRALAGRRSCEIHCFRNRPCSAPSEFSYHLYLDEEEARIAAATTDTLDQLHSCVAAWVGEQLPLQTLCEQFDFVERHRTSPRLPTFLPARVSADKNPNLRSNLAQHIDRALSEAGSEIQTGTEGISDSAPDATLWIRGSGRSCGLLPTATDAVVRCEFVEAGTALAICMFADWDAAAKGVLLWLDQQAGFPELFEAIADMETSDIAEIFEVSVLAGLCWLNSIRKARKGFHSEIHVPILQRFCSTPEIGRFFAHTSMELIRISQCSHDPPSLAGMPVIGPSPRGYAARCGNEKIEGNIDQTVDFVARCLQEQSRQPFVGCADDLIFEPLNACLAAQGSTVSLERVSKGFSTQIIARRGYRTCRLSFNESQEFPYLVRPQAGRQGFGSLAFRELGGTAAALRMWLEQSCKFEDISAAANNFSHPDHARLDPGATN